MLQSEVLCRECKYISKAFDPFLDLSVSINSTKLTECLKFTFSKEKLDDGYLCDKCKKTSKAFRLITISTLPKYLVLHLKRFLFVDRLRKIEQRIEFPLDNLNMGKYIISFYKYNN